MTPDDPRWRMGGRGMRRDPARDPELPISGGNIPKDNRDRLRNRLFAKGLDFFAIAYLVSFFLDSPVQGYLVWGVFIVGSYWWWYFIIAANDRTNLAYISISLILLTFFWYMVFFGKGIYY